MAKKLDSVTRFNKNAAELLIGHAPGRPTFSGRAGKHIGRAFGVSMQAGTDIFHAGLVIGAVVWWANRKK